jgi:prepilin signal peptidase PulO-like enzyme (type II secretory pathway)
MEILTYITIFILGTCLGSFYACIGYRIPNKISTVKPNSFCPNCKTPLKWYMNIPLFSFIYLKGKCAFCKEKISRLYIITELLTGILFTASYIYFGISKELFISLTLISVLAVTMITDLKYLYISDRVIVLSIIIELITYMIYLNKKDITYLIISAITMFGIMYAIKLLGDFVFKRESLGGGDIKLMLLVGLTLGIIDAVTSLLISSTLALIFSIIIMKKNEEKIVPFGPFLIIGTMIMFILSYNGINII